MATTTVSYDGDGSQVDFTITYAYTDQTFVEVYVDSVLKTKGTHYNFFSTTVIRFTGGNTPPAGTNNVELRRVTSTTPLIDWSSGASLPEADLDKADLQMLHIVEELENDFSIGMGKSGTNWDATSLRILNVSAPIADTDVATKASIAAQVTAAELAETNAETAETAAAASETAAATSETNAATSETNAAASAATAITVYPQSGLTVGEMIVADGAASMANLAVLHEEFIAQGNIPNATTFTLSLPATTLHFRVYLKGLRPATTDRALQMIVSVDSGSSYFETSDYSFWLQNDLGGVAADVAGNTGNFIELGRAMHATYNGDWVIDIFPGDGTTPGRITWVGYYFHKTAGNQAIATGSACLIPATSTTRWTNIRFFLNSSALFVATGKFFIYKVVGAGSA